MNDKVVQSKSDCAAATKNRNDSKWKVQITLLLNVIN